MNIFVKFGFENIEKNYYEFYDVTDIRVENGYLKFEYLGKRLGTIQTANFPAHNTWYGIKEVERKDKEK